MTSADPRDLRDRIPGSLDDLRAWVQSAVGVFAIIYPMITSWCIMSISWEQAMRKEIFYVLLHYKVASAAGSHTCQSRAEGSHCWLSHGHLSLCDRAVHLRGTMTRMQGHPSYLPPPEQLHLAGDMQTDPSQLVCSRHQIILDLEQQMWVPGRRFTRSPLMSFFFYWIIFGSASPSAPARHHRPAAIHSNTTSARCTQHCPDAVPAQA